MNFDTYLRLVLETTGTLLALFLMILIVGYRRRRTFERVLFFLALALFLNYAARLLFDNSLLYYTDMEPLRIGFEAIILATIGLAAIPGLLVHSHFAFGWGDLNLPRRWWQVVVIGLSYFPSTLIAWFFLSRPLDNDSIWLQAGLGSSPIYLVWLSCVLAGCAALQLTFARRQQRKTPRYLYNFLAAYFAGFGLLAINYFMAHYHSIGRIQSMSGLWEQPSWKPMAMTFEWILPLALIVYAIVRYRALGIGSQKNLVYSVSIAFLAILYLSVVRRLSGWLEPFLPPEATASILLFVLVAFFEPLQRLASRLLRRRFQEQVDRLQHLSSDLQREALRGELTQFLDFAEGRVRQEFGLEEVRIQLNGSASDLDDPGEEPTRPMMKSRPGWFGQPVRLTLGKKGAEIGELVALPIGSAISGETMAALEFLADQLPSTIELCRVIHQKIELERELEERERMALIGQMAASISHNLKNPLGSIKTILQVQMENPELPASMRGETEMVLDEIGRLSAKLSQLLQFRRPAVRGGSVRATCRGASRHRRSLGVLVVRPNAAEE